MTHGDPLLAVDGLTVSAGAGKGQVDIVRDVSFSLHQGEVLGLVGESGSGKTMTALALLRVLPPAVGITTGRVLFAGRDLTRIGDRELRAVRGGEVAMVFQDPAASLNPVFTIGRQLAAVLEAHRVVSRRGTRGRCLELLRRVRLPDPEAMLDRYPHELSGGMRQRVMIAMAVACRPRVLIADEPTTALDVTVQSHILRLLRELRDETGAAVIYISHDLAVVAQVADRVAVMYAGSLVEQGGIRETFANPLHPYAQALLAVNPRIDAPKGQQLRAVQGSVPMPGRLPSGCPFHPRCPHAMPQCSTVVPALTDVAGRTVTCHLYDANEASPPDGRLAVSAPAEAE